MLLGTQTALLSVITTEMIRSRKPWQAVFTATFPLNPRRINQTLKLDLIASGFSSLVGYHFRRVGGWAAFWGFEGRRCEKIIVS